MQAFGEDLIAYRRLLYAGVDQESIGGHLAVLRAQQLISGMVGVHLGRLPKPARHRLSMVVLHLISFLS